MAPSMHHVDQMMQEAVGQGIFPGAQLVVATADGTLFEQSYGMANLFSGVPLAGRMLFDLASLTKPLATVLAVMSLVKQGRMQLEQTCGELCLQMADSDKAGITLRQLLNHSSGMPPWRPYFMRLRHLPKDLRRPGLHRLLLDEPLCHPPGLQSEYSDLGYMMLQWIVEEICGTGLDGFVDRDIYRPLGIEELSFNPLEGGRNPPEHFAATQLCPWRNRLLVGHVDDDNAFIQGGIGGHAGLFGTARGVVKLLQHLLAADQDNDGGGTFDPGVVKLFFRRGDGERWALGFDTPSAKDSSAGNYFPRDSVGHLGFTGTSFWVHRQRRRIVVLLTNRVHPWRFNPGIRQFRPRLHDCIMESLS